MPRSLIQAGCEYAHGLLVEFFERHLCWGGTYAYIYISFRISHYGTLFSSCLACDTLHAFYCCSIIAHLGSVSGSLKLQLSGQNLKNLDSLGIIRKSDPFFALMRMNGDTGNW